MQVKPLCEPRLGFLSVFSQKKKLLVSNYQIMCFEKSVVQAQDGGFSRENQTLSKHKECNETGASQKQPKYF